MPYKYFTSWKQGAYFDYSDATGKVVLITRDQTTDVYERVTDVDELLGDVFCQYEGSFDTLDEFLNGISVKIEEGRAMSNTVNAWLNANNDFKWFRRHREWTAKNAFRVGENVSWDHKGRTQYGEVVEHLPGGGFIHVKTLDGTTRRVSIGNVVEKMFPELHEEYTHDDD